MFSVQKSKIRPILTPEIWMRFFSRNTMLLKNKHLKTLEFFSSVVGHAKFRNILTMCKCIQGRNISQWLSLYSTEKLIKDCF